MSLLFVFHFTEAQTDSLQWLDIELSNYKYPYPVSNLELNIQEQDLKMAYMDIKPENYNGKISCYSMEKILMEPFGKQL